MARNDKLKPGIQVFRGSRPRQDVFAANAGVGCCDNSSASDYDKLAERTRFDNSLAHSNPTGVNDKFAFPYGDGFSDTRNNIINLINKEGVGAHISILAIPTYAFVTGIGIHIEADEPGLTFDLVTRNGLVLPGTADTNSLAVEGSTTSIDVDGTTYPLTPGAVNEPTGCVKIVEATIDDCDVVRTLTEGDASTFEGFGALGNGVAFMDIFGRSAGCGEFSLEADEIALRVASMPADGVVTGAFSITVSVSYDVIHRAEN